MHAKRLKRGWDYGQTEGHGKQNLEMKGTRKAKHHILYHPQNNEKRGERALAIACGKGRTCIVKEAKDIFVSHDR